MTCTAQTKKLDLATLMPSPWRAAPDAKTIVLDKVPEHTPLPGALPKGVQQVQVVAAEQVMAAVHKERPRPEVFALIRRVALQRDLGNAVGVLHHELGVLVRASVVLAVVTDGAISSPRAEDLRTVAPMVPLAAIDMCTKKDQPVIGQRAIMIPIDLGVPAVLVCCRPLQAPAFEPDTVVVIASVANRLAMLDHFFAADADKKRQAADDEKSIFRPEALAASRDDKREGQLVGLTSRWVRLAVPVILAILIGLIVAGSIITVPTYSTGTGIVSMNGTNVISNASGPITRTLVTTGQVVKAGQPMFELDTQKERSDFEQIDTIYRNQLSTFLFDLTDENARQSLGGIIAQRTSAQAALTAKTIVAPIDGTVSAILAHDIASAGEQVATIVPDGAEPTLTAYMEGNDVARFPIGTQMQFRLPGYDDVILTLAIDHVEQVTIGQAEARKRIGQSHGDAVPLPQSVVVVTAKLPSKTFISKDKELSFAEGMNGPAEIAIENKPFLSTIFATGG